MTSKLYIAKIDEKIFMPRTVARQDKSFLYAICKKTNYLTEEANCQIYLKSSSSSATTSSCALNLTSYQNRTLQISHNSLHLESFGAKRAVITWFEVDLNQEKKSGTFTSYAHITIIDLKSCGVYTIPLDLKATQWIGTIVYPEKLDIVLTDRRICGDFRICVISYDERGEPVDDLVIFPLEHPKPSLQPISPRSENNGLFVLVKDERMDELQVVFIDDNEEEKVLFQGDLSSGGSSDYSDTYGFFTWCRLDRKKSKSQCVQYNPSNDEKMEKTLVIDMDVKRLSVSNLPGGGFLLLSTKCDKTFQLVCSEFNVIKVDSHGRKKELIEDTPLYMRCIESETTSLMTNIAEVGNEICFIFACYDKVSMKEAINLFTECTARNKI
ncbi:hypothetical protein QAD02_012058 [Eretmocerus hayati]|uniref:Uncharacterized protein n=1 Tax=Eretmocerus hayati TaxID=131215 RepID=A0ACC2P1E2_9HYME|nr:hypothetical protein QAD02_012058 [Eretmocerus hayati]